MKTYYRAIAQTDVHRPKRAQKLAGGWCWFDRVEVLERGKEPTIVDASNVPGEVLECMTSVRDPLAKLDMCRPNVMGILNVTPDSFSDGGKFASQNTAKIQSLQMFADGADILDIGGESTRPGAVEVSTEDEIERVVPVIEAARQQSEAPISIDTRKSKVARAAIAAGATLLNDVSAMEFDPEIAQVAAQADVPICLMHAQGRPENMQQNPRYDSVLLDVYDHLEDCIKVAEKAGISRSKIIIDPGIGFGKTQEHNLELLRRIALFHSLGCAILLGASRKKFIGTISEEPLADQRLGGSLAIAVKAAQQGVQILRVHDTKETSQALRLAQVF